MINFVILVAFATPLSHLMPVFPDSQARLLYAGITTFGAITVITGIWTVVQHARGMHHQPGVLGASLVVIGLITTGWSLFYFLLIDLCYSYNGCI